MRRINAKYPTLFSLYIAQSIPMSFFSTVVPVIMREENYSLESIGLLQLIKLPWIFKFLWAPFIDNHTRSKKQLRNWIIASELFYAAVIMSIGLFDLQTDFKLIIGLLLLAFSASATQDIATDIFAIYILKKKERSVGNSIQSAGSFIGSLFGTGVLLIAYHHFGWTWLLVCLALCVAFAIIPIMRYRKPIHIAPKGNQNISFLEIGRFFSDHVLRRRVVLLVFYYSGIIGILSMLKPYLVDLGYNAKEIGFMSGIVGTTVATLSSLSAGLVIRKIGKRTSFYGFLALGLMAALFFYSLPAVPALWQVYIGICLLWGSYGFMSVIIYTSSMDSVRQHREGTDFTLQIVITHLSSIIIAILSGKIGDALGYKGLFGLEIILISFTFFILLFIVPPGRKRAIKMLRRDHQ